MKHLLRKQQLIIIRTALIRKNGTKFMGHNVNINNGRTQ